MSHKVFFSLRLCMAIVAVAMFPIHAGAMEGNWQLGVVGGASYLSPDTDDSDYTLEDDQSTSLSVYVGFDITPILSAELSFTNLGEAILSQDEVIAYQAVAIGATAYIFGEKEATYRADGTSGYIRLGLSSFDNESDIQLSKADNTAILVAAGVQFPLAENWGIRAELARYSGDAQTLQAGFYWRSGNRYQSRPAPPLTTKPIVVQPREPTPDPTPIQAEPPVQQKAQLPDENTQFSQRIGGCPVEQAGRFDNPADCALLNRQLSDLAFASISADIIDGTTASLETVADFLKQNPRRNIEILVHVKSTGNTRSDANLSALRARSVARYLVQKGVLVTQLRARSFGSTQPLLNDTISEANNRVVLRSF